MDTHFEAELNVMLIFCFFFFRYPGKKDEPAHTAHIETILSSGACTLVSRGTRKCGFPMYLFTVDSGVNCFVCLQPEAELRRFTCYRSVVRSIAPDVEHVQVGIDGETFVYISICL